MKKFLCESLKPEIFWSALSAIGAMAAVITALFLPVFTNYRKKRKIAKLLVVELGDCMKEVKNSGQLDGIPDGLKGVAKAKFLSRMNTEAWDAHKNYLLANDPDCYMPYRKIYKLISHIKAMASNPTPESIIVLDHDVASLLAMHEELPKH